jgi:hypothetical protein
MQMGTGGPFPSQERIRRMKTNTRAKAISLYPLKFDEVVSDVVKVKPESKKAARKTETKRGKGRDKT